MTVTLNYRNDEMVSSPSVIVCGSTSVKIGHGLVKFTNNQNRVFPPQYFEVNNSNFKAVVHVSGGERNQFDIEVYDHGSLNGIGFPDFSSQNPRVVDRSEWTVWYQPLPMNKPVHMCVIVGRDSDGSYDMPGYRLGRGEYANLDTAVKKLKVAARLMQAYTQDEMRLVGFSNRSFQFVEETVSSQNIFGYSVDSPVPHQEVKIHVLRSPKTVKELRDPNLAQQNSKGTDTGGLFNHAIDLIKNTPEIFNKYREIKTAIQCAVLYLDAHFDTAQNLILTHAALGGGTNEVKLAIFGSHGLHSWPINFAQVTPSFLDSTHLSIKEVANDCNQCGTSWECLNITLGAFMHEIGHLLGSPHQVDGVMLRDYIWWNRSFMTRELECLREKSSGQTIQSNGTWPKVCHWNKLDLIRFLHHDSFSIPTDANDPTFGKSSSTTMRPDNDLQNGQKAPTLYTTPQGVLVKSLAGIFLIELVVKDLARYSIPYYPKTYGGNGHQHELTLDHGSLFNALKANSKEVSENFDIRVLSVGGDLYIKDFKSQSSVKTENIIKSDFGLGNGTVVGYKSALLGQSKGKSPDVVEFNLRDVYKVRIYHGGALDGIRFYCKTKSRESRNGPPKVPPRNYLSKMVNKISKNDASSGGNTEAEKEVVIGNVKHHFSDFVLNENEEILKFHVKNGAWIDAIQFETNAKRLSPMYGNAGGGHASCLEAPSEGYTIVGMYGYVGSWLDGLGIIYTSR